MPIYIYCIYIASSALPNLFVHSCAVLLVGYYRVEYMYVVAAVDDGYIDPFTRNYSTPRVYPDS